jgi:phosphoenolpyruvate carboxykinase (ATP)
VAAVKAIWDDAGTLLEEVAEAVRQLHHQPNVITLDRSKLKALAEQHAVKTVYGSLVFSTSVRNRSAALTVCIGSPRVMDYDALTDRQKELVRRAPETIEAVHRYLKRAPLLYVEKVMGRNEEFTPRCMMYVSLQRRDSIRLAYMLDILLFDSEGARIANGSPELYLVYVPEWQEKDRQILVFPEVGVTYVLGTDYFGEAKKGFLRMAMWFAKQRGMLGIHAGAKLVRARGVDGRLRRYSMLLFGLSATGKTTHTCHHHGLDVERGEGMEAVQDDVVFLKMDGSALGTENGFFLKTDIDPVNQPLIWEAATKSNAVFENVMVDYKGEVDFLDSTLTGNARGVFPRSDLNPAFVSPSINLPPLSELDGMVILFITRRNTVVPIASRLTVEQAAAAFMLGESVETAAGDPTKAGRSVRVVGTNPFIVGDPVEEGLWFYNFLRLNRDKVQCYLLNTGGVGEIRVSNGYRTYVKQRCARVEIRETAAIIRGILRGSIKWRMDPYFGVEVPEEAEEVDLSRFDLKRYYSDEQLEAYVRELKLERARYLLGRYRRFVDCLEVDERAAKYMGLDLVKEGLAAASLKAPQEPEELPP